MTNSADVLDLRQVASLLWTNKWRIGIGTLAGGVVMTVVAMLTTPMYRSQSILAVRSDSSGLAGLGGLSSQIGMLAEIGSISLSSQSSDRSVALATLTSRVVIEGFVAERELLPLLFPEKWDEDSRRWDDGDKVPTGWHAYDIFVRKVLSVAENRKTGLITVAVEWRDPEVAAQWLREIVLRTNALLRERSLKESAANLAYLREQMKVEPQLEIKQVIYRLIETELKKSLLARGNDDYGFIVIDPADVPQKPVWPKSALLVLVGLTFGALISIAAIVVMTPPRNA